jgi:hypothetical protein
LRYVDQRGDDVLTKAAANAHAKILAVALAWRRDNTSPLLARFIGELQRMPEVRAVNKS